MESNKKRSRSIAKRLNAELEWRKFGKNLFMSLFAEAALLIGWCWYREGFGNILGVSRSFAGRLRFFGPGEVFRALAESPGDMVVLVQRVLLRADVAYGRFFLFKDIHYVFSSGGMTRSISAENILALVFFSFLLFNLIGFIHAVFRTVAGSGTIRKYLRPLDDMANLAEQLSAERHSVDEAGVRSEVKTDP